MKLVCPSCFSIVAMEKIYFLQVSKIKNHYRCPKCNKVFTYVR